MLFDGVIMQPSVGLSRSSSTRGVIPSKSNSNWKIVITNRFSDEPVEYNVCIVYYLSLLI